MTDTVTDFAEEVRRHRSRGGEAPIRWRACLDSTNEEAFRLAERELAPEGTAVAADAQTKGRGRLGRAWFSPPGAGLYLSVLLRPPESASSPALLTLVAGVAVAEALEREAGRGPRLKWPNDLLYGGLKVGGILTEARAGRGRAVTAVVGIGVNVLQRPEDFPPEIRLTATSVAAATGRRPERAALAAGILDALDAGYRDWLRHGFGRAAEAWRRKTSTLGKRVRFVQGGLPVEGWARDLAEDGSLVVETPSGVTRIRSGEVTEIKVAECSS
ncbi:MAG: biotin--[acetyl-CoA-carboxylase] ligase [Candidatus Tectomicrobia bacterium]|nr:biotin--[acetyl-CoA-carboxylase] ligase [Candidatus Tectomicrobia bacterium]